MCDELSSRIMARTTVDIDAAVLRDLKRLQKRQGKPLGQLISELVAAALFIILGVVFLIGGVPGL